VNLFFQQPIRPITEWHVQIGLRCRHHPLPAVAAGVADAQQGWQAAREEDLVRQQVFGVLSLLVCKVLFHDCCLETDASDRWAAGGSPAVRSRNAAQAAPSANASAGPAGEAASDADASAAAPQLQPDGSTAAAGDGRPRSAKRQSRGGPAQVSAAGDCPFPAAATEGGGEATEVPGRKRGPHWIPLEMCPILMQGVIPSLLPRD
jgi:hypothetical protein